MNASAPAAARSFTSREGCIAIFTVHAGTIQAVREYMDTLYAGRAFSAESIR